MNWSRFVRMATLVGSGVVLLQGAGCTFQNFLQLVQTAFLGVTAAGSFAILQNI